MTGASMPSSNDGKGTRGFWVEKASGRKGRGGNGWTTRVVLHRQEPLR